jgi:hypothetical protein
MKDVATRCERSHREPVVGGDLCHVRRQNLPLTLPVLFNNDENKVLGSRKDEHVRLTGLPIEGQPLVGLARDRRAAEDSSQNEGTVAGPES